ncbi:uncharacterized protein BJ171DRAFT_600257 [Polychytrium aggregatum]|uniref:uncharacterized protein n=1 Tax=Polychytrium aggregatum TaxID=110093 RepID=UPI0022FE324E|nr:uncharacterized protein BJ171DRAFT_600257 [Polychytrium aggregatum]KAI9203105.1 hypothetical protein BJ171DRAFT_600257 [Polychytrium aggregatum]
MRGLGERKKFVFFNVSLDVPHIREREMVENKAQGDKELAMLQVKDLTEEEYDAMSELEKEQYDTGLLKYKRRLKEIQDRRKVERRHWEEEVAQRMGERKVEEEAKPVKKKTARGARSTAGKSSDKSTGKSAKAGEKGGGGGSPKLARKTVSDRNDKGMPDKAEKSDRDRPDRLEKLEDENASRLTLSEYGDIFFAEQTSRRYEAYAAALEAMMVFIKEGDKPNAARAANGPGANDARKPTKAASKVPSTGAAISTQEPPPAGSTVFTDGELHVTEDGTQVSYQEVNGAMDEASLFKAMAEHIPKKEETAPPPEPVDVIPAPLVEQIVHFPGERDVHPLQQHFCLLPPVTAAEAEEEGAAQPDGSVSVVVPTIKTEPQAPGKKTRFTNKFAEDTRVPENEEETVVKDVQTKFRWIVQPKEKKELTIRFSSNETGKFEQTITFEIVGGRGKFSLHCVGFCQHSQINGDYRKIFSKFRKSKEEKAIVHGEFIASTSTFEFGPLLYSKPREKYLEKFPENRAILTITNATTNDIKIHFSLKHDVKSDVFFYEPAIMDLGPQQTLPFTLWAYPRSSNTFEDTLICCVRDNPEPYLFKVSCIGVKPELEIDKKFLSFDKILLGRTEKREIKLKNNTYMPVAWKLVGVDGLGDEFSAAPTEGIIDSFTESVVTAEFHGNKPVVVKRMIRLEVSDTEKIGGVVQEVPILVTAEAYDIAVDVHFPKGYEGGIDFGVLKVIPPKDPKDPKDPKALKDTAVSPPEDTVKLETKTWTLKNKGKYEVGYRIVYEKEEYKYMFPIAPSVGPLQPSDKPVSVTIGIRPSHEFTLKDIVIARYQFFEPSTLEVTATVPVKICARTVFSRFSVLPVQDLNFGALVFGIKGTRQFTIENMGEFDFKYGIYKIVQGMLDAKQGKRTNTSRMSKIVRPNSPPPTTKGPNRKEFSKMGDAANFGAFTVFPTNGTVAAGMKQQITVEFHSDTPGSFEEMIALDISDRPPTEDVIAYRLMGESCVPGINTYDLSSIFEEHTICKRLELFNSQGNIYAEEDRVFYFGAYLVFSQGQARFKIINPYKITCDVSLATKPRSKTKSDTADFAFDVDPKKLTIPSHEYRYVTVSFHPTLIQSYAGIFEAVVENVSESKSKILSFEIRGEGSLPRVVIEKPTTKSKLGAPLLKFRRILVGASQSQSILVRNEGILPATIKFEWGPKDSSDFECGSVNKTHTLRPQEMRSFELLFTPRSIRKVESDIRIRVIDNNFEDIVVQLAGEGYMDDLTFDNLGGESNQNELIMSDCHLNEIRTCSFLVGNNSNDVLRIIWPENTDFVFSPMVAHVRAKGSKEFGISFCPKQPCDYKAVQLACKSIKIRYTGATLESDWDDRSKAIKWTTDRGGKDATAPRKVVETYPEPAYEMAQGAIFTEHVLLVSAFADYCEYECDINAINFKSTLMFQTRVYRFSVKNTGKVVLKYTFGFYTDSGQPVDQAYDDCPFSVVPAGGSIEVGEALVVTVRFAPQDVASYNFTLYGMMPNLHKEQKALVIKVSGESLRPFCHFELSDSDYITGERRNPEVSAANGVPVTLEPNTKVVEFGSCGVRVRNTKRFYIVNPTNTTYEFEWTHEAGNDAKVFRCLTPRGIVLSTKKFEMAFEFTPETIELKESLWRFTILGHNLSIPFLLVGQALEPNVFMDRVSVNFKSILVGRQAREVVKLVNNESIPFAFVFNETSFELSPDGTPVLQYSPSSGTVGAHGEVPIDVVFCPSSEKSFNFNLMCNVRKKPTPVGINIKGEGYEIHESLQSELADGSVFELVSSPGDNTIDFGQVQLNEKRLKNVTIINSGRFNFDYSWKFLNKPGGLLSISPEIGTVNKGERAVCEITFLPSSSICLKNVKGICQIVNGRTYTVSITGSGCKPMLKLSKTVHDFGTQFVQRQGLTPASTTVTVTNDDVKEVSYDIIAPDTGVFDIQQGPRTLAPGESSVIEATFYPKEPKKYSEIVTIDVNNLPTMQLELLGEGTEFKIEVLNLENRALNFGAVRVGHVVTRTVKIINRSPIQTLFSLGTPASIEALSANMVTFAHPLNEITLRPKGILNLDLKFYPQQRIPPFSEEVFLEAPGFSRPLFVVMGACQGIEVKLENETLPFGAVVQRSCTTRRIQLQNVGDIGAKFHWDISKLSPDFSVSPHEGYISPSMEIPLEIEFHPTEVNPDIRYENVPCIIEGSAPIYLTLTGMCVSQPLQNEAVKFSSPVRQSDVKSITLTNKTTTPWRIRPIIDNEYWSGPEVFDVEAGQTKSYDVAFTPLDMIGSGDAGRHEGSIFFPLPDGNGMLYKLYGTAERPLPAGTITREVPCKTPYTEVISVTNWLKRPQRFRVVTEVAKADPSVILKGHDFIDVPGLLTKEYKLSFYAYREGITNAKVTFKNEQTQEYLFYNLAFKSTPPGVIGVLELNSVVRQVNSKEITLNNPLNSPVTFTAACPHPEITLPHTFTAQAKSDAVCLVEFLPLLPREATTRLTITSQDLGLYQYDMRLISTVASPERSLHFKVGLGGSQTQIFRFLSYAKSKTEFTCKADSPDFSVEKSVTAPSASGSGVEVSLDVTYEPSKLGDVRTQLVVSSSTGGDYCCSLYGHCIAPRPQGPITIKAGSAASVPFKNVFAQSATFTFVMDNAAFTVKATEAIPAKKTITMAITALPISAQAAASKLPKFGKLTVTHKGSNISWVYYLKSA